MAQTKIKIGNIEIVEPRQIVYDVFKYKNSGTVLDLGSGFGRHSLLLAYKGFQVTAVEIEQDKLDKLNENAKKLGVHIVTIRSDVADFIPTEKYDVILSTMVLHFLSKDNAQKAITLMKEYTNTDGLNVVTVYTNENPVNLRPYLFEKNELRNLYAGWDILEYQETLGPETENPKDGGPSRRYSARLIAKKIANKEL
jgi:tellurite methyltransferase